jgi:CRISPR-associated endonuclease Csn1
LLGCLALANPNVLDETGAVRTKTEIRGITHLHHALGACTIGLASHYLPRDGGVWEMLVKRRLDDAEKLKLRAATHGLCNFSADRRFGLLDLPREIKEDIRQRLAERRVVQHVPAKIDGLRIEQNTWRLVKVENGIGTLRQRIRAADGSRPTKETKENLVKLLGPSPDHAGGKLAAIKGALVIPDNFGVALDPEPQVIPFHKVWNRLRKLKEENGGKMPRVLRNGQLIRIPRGRYLGLWKVFSAKNAAAGLLLDIGQADIVRLLNRTEGHKINVLLATLLRDGLEIMPTRLVGVALPPEVENAE